MQTNRQVVYVPDADVHLAREMGMTNFSGFVREQLKEYVMARKAALRQMTSGSQQHSPLVVQQ